MLPGLQEDGPDSGRTAENHPSITWSTSRCKKYEQAKPSATFLSRQQLIATLLWQFNYSLSCLHYCLFPSKDEWEEKVWTWCFLAGFLITSLEGKRLQFVVSDCGGFYKLIIAELLWLILVLSAHSKIKHHGVGLVHILLRQGAFWWLTHLAKKIIRKNNSEVCRAAEHLSDYGYQPKKVSDEFLL